jgi:acyl-CoA reductase-like NAD-dependent aldehyde dehydrogenase
MASANSQLLEVSGVESAPQMTLVERFERAINKGPDAFNELALELQNSSPTFREHSVTLDEADALGHPPENSTLQTAISAVFGEQLPYYLKKTPDDVAEKMLEDGQELAALTAQMPVSEHVRFMRILKEELQAVEEKIVLSIMADTGKPISLCRAEMVKGMKWFASLFENAEAQIANRKPIGTVQVTPSFNYPFAIGMAGIAGAGASGSPQIIAGPLKASAWLFHAMDAVKKATKRFEPDVKIMGQAFVEAFNKLKHALIQFNIGISAPITKNADLEHFVGSEVTGKIIDKQREGKRTILEMGGPNTAMVMGDAVENPAEAQKIIDMIYAKVAPAAGQSCTNLRRLIVLRCPAGMRFVEGLINKFETTDHHIGNPANKDTQVGPVVDQRSFEGMKSTQKLAEKVGAYCSGMEVDVEKVPMAAYPNAQYAKPMVTVWDMPPLQDEELIVEIYDRFCTEYFSPELQVIFVDSFEEGVAMARFTDPESRVTGAAFIKNPEKLEKYEEAVAVTNFGRNVLKSDASPDGLHGHPGRLKIGGPNHYGMYCSDEQRPAVNAQEPNLQLV